MPKGFAVVATPPSGQVTQIGTDHARGVWVEGVSWEHSLVDHGALRAQFTLKRDGSIEWPDLQPFTPITIYKDGSVAWQGRVQETPTIRGLEDQVTVVCEGWPAHLKDDAIEKTFVHNDLTAWRNVRALVSTDLSVFTSAFDVNVGDGAITIAVPTGNTAVNLSNGGVQLDLGPYSTCKRIVITYSGAASSLGLYVAAGDTETASDESNGLDAAPLLAANTVAQTWTKPRRFVRINLGNGSGGSVAGSDTAWLRIENIIVFADTAYESGNLSILKASSVIAGVLPYAPKVSQSTAEITVPSFSIPHFAGPLTSPLDYMEAANDYHRYQLFLRDDSAGGPPRLVFRPIPTAALLVANVGDGIVFEDASRNDGGDIYNRCIVEYTDPAGNTAREDRNTSGLSATFADPDIVFDTASAIPAGPNPGFETAGGPPATGWAGATGTMTRDTGVFDSGTASGLLSCGAAGFLDLYYQPISGLTPGKTYRLQYRVRAHAGWTMAGVLRVQAATIDGNIYAGGGQDSFTNAIGTSFTTRTLMFIAPSNGTIRLLMIANGSPLAAGVANIAYFDGLQLFEARPTIIDRQGFVRTRVLTTGSRLVPVAAQQLGDALLQAHRFTPLRGTLTVQGPSLRTLLGDAPIPAHLVGGRYLGDAVLINETNPDTSAIGRVGIIASAAYDEPSDTVKIAIDQTKDFISAIQARLGIFA